MSFPELLALAVALAMDALAVSIAAGITLGRPRPAQLARMPLTFGLFQAAMPIAGWLLGARLGRLDCVRRWASAAGGLVLLGIGVKILYEHGIFNGIGG